MSKAHFVELRRRVVEAYERGKGSYAIVAATFQVGKASAKLWVWQFRDVGHLRPKK